jgi:hypothetical protein
MRITTTRNGDWIVTLIHFFPIGYLSRHLMVPTQTNQEYDAYVICVFAIFGWIDIRFSRCKLSLTQYSIEFAFTTLM